MSSLMGRKSAAVSILNVPGDYHRTSSQRQNEMLMNDHVRGAKFEELVSAAFVKPPGTEGIPA